jgi:hypothetical protein
MTMDNKPCPLSEEREALIRRIDAFTAGESCEVQAIVKDCRLLLSLAVPDASAHSQAEPVYWEFRAKDTHPDTVTSGQWFPWERLVPRNGLETVESRLAEIKEYIAAGYQYELRALYTAPPAPFSEAVPLTHEEVEQCFMAWGHPAPDFHVAFLKDDIQDVARLLFRKVAEHSEADCDDLHIAYLHGQQRERERSREAVKDLDDLAKSILSVASVAGLEYAKEQARAALAKHGTQAATPSEASTFIPWGGIGYVTASTASPSDLTAYGEKVREAAAKAAESFADEKANANQLERAIAADRCAARIRSMPLPAAKD